MAALLRLLQLLRVTEQNEAPSSRRTARTLPGTSGPPHRRTEGAQNREILSTPEPRSTAKNIHSTTLQALQRFFIRINLAYRSAVAIGTLPLVRTTYLSDIHVAGSIQDLIKQFANDLVTDCRDSHLFPEIYQLANHASAGERLPRARRALNGKH
jgi:hypothetical protein